MTDNQKIREELLSIIESNPGVWYDVSYKLRYNADGSLDFDQIQQVKSSNKSEDGK